MGEPVGGDPHVERHAAVVLAATRVLAQIHEETAGGLREVEVLLGGAMPAAIESSIMIEQEALSRARGAIVELQPLVGHGARAIQNPPLDERPRVEEVADMSHSRAVAMHLVAVRRWNLTSRGRLRAGIETPAAVLADMLRREGRDLTAAIVEDLWCRRARP